MNWPILFNALKHHKASIRAFITNPPESWQHDILVIGHSLVDLYLGNLSIEQIYTEVMEYLTLEKIGSVNDFESWIHQGKGYKIIQLSDQSLWTLRRSKANDVQYIHIHPGRYSPHTLRVKSETLKTAIAYHCLKFYGYFKNFHEKESWCSDQEFTATVNSIRSRINLSPIKKADKNGKTYWLICNLPQD